jgi:glycosyltransferase involved in cell wall biosynthesis
LNKANILVEFYGDGMSPRENRKVVNNKKKPFLSIITVVLNGERYLERTIKSVISQDFNDYEYIVIDGGSSDGTLNIIKHYEGFIDYWVSEPDKGIYDAMNKGISLASGDFIGLINADDYYENDAFEKVSKLCEKGAIVYGDMVTHFESGDTFTHKIPIPKNKENVRHSAVHPTVFVSSDLYRLNGTFNTKFKLSADYDLLIRMFRCGAKYIKYSGVLAHFQEGGASANGAGSKEGLMIAKEHGFRRSEVLKKEISIVFVGFKIFIRVYLPSIVVIFRKFRSCRN